MMLSQLSGVRVSARVAPRRAQRSTVAAVAATKQSWLPGVETPAYLDGSLPGDFGFDPLKLAEKPANLARYREAELIHCRWAMLGAAGFIAVEALGYGDWITAAYWPVTGEPMTYFGQPVPFDVPAVTAIEAVAIAYVESARNNETDSIKRIYPGFDPLGLTKDAKAFETAKWQEIRNGRLAMLAMIGFWGQAVSTGQPPLANLAAHIADPFAVNVAASNPIALPF